MKVDWKRKLTSRKFWMAVIGLVVSIMMLFNVDSEKQERITAVITATATLMTYIIGESIVDKDK